MRDIIAEAIHVRDVSSGRIHKRWRIPGSGEVLSFEADNADSAGAYEVVQETDLADAPASAWCKSCFPSAEGDISWRDAEHTMRIAYDPPGTTTTSA